jgi:hypothetical protein
LLALAESDCGSAANAVPALEADRADLDSFADLPDGEAPEGRLPYGLRELPLDDPDDDGDTKSLF